MEKIMSKCKEMFAKCKDLFCKCKDMCMQGASACSKCYDSCQCWCCGSKWRLALVMIAEAALLIWWFKK